MKRRKKRIAGPVENMLARQTEYEARQMAKQFHGSDGLWELYLMDAYRRCAGLPPIDYSPAAVCEPKEE